MKPQHKHDCDRCEFLGRDEKTAGDLYYCPNPREASLICRLSSEPSDYLSFPVTVLEANFDSSDSPLKRAYRLAAERGFLVAFDDLKNQHPALLAVFNEVGDYLKSYRSDFFVHDRALLSQYADRELFWFIRPTGTHLIPLGPGETTEKDHDLVEVLYEMNDRHFYWNGCELAPISFEKLKQLLVDRRPLHFQI